MNYLHIDTASMTDGIGVRVVLWLSGCPHHCKGCQNPESWDSSAGNPFSEETLNELFQALNKPYVWGLTLSGGDPLAPENREGTKRLAKAVKSHFPEKTIWCYTGYNYEDIQDLPALDYIDVLVDGPFEIDKRDVSLRFRGSPNQRIIQLKKGESARC